MPVDSFRYAQPSTDSSRSLPDAYQRCGGRNADSNYRQPELDLQCDEDLLLAQVAQHLLNRFLEQWQPEKQPFRPGLPTWHSSTPHCVLTKPTRSP